MKVKQRTICQACRKGKITCDGKTPACSQCALRGLNCPGYPPDWVFVSQNTHSRPKVRARRELVRGDARRCLRANAERTPPSLKSSDAMALNDLVMTIIASYVPEEDSATPSASIEPSPRICGAWVEVLPELVSNDPNTALASAIRAFAVTILSRGPDRRFPVSESLEAYSKALVSVNDALRSSYGAFPVEIAAAVMCLLLVELFHTTSLCSWKTHLRGLADLMQLSRPELYATGIPHRLFLGARPVLVVLAFVLRKSSFLAEEEWRSTPFREASPSPAQALMSEAAIIPTLLERVDGGCLSAAAASGILHNFEAVLDRLDSWAEAFQTSASKFSPLFWFQPADSGGKEHIWFQNITVANALTHLWAFRAICLRTIDELRAPSLHPSLAPSKSHFKEIKRLSVMICQSTEYLMQEKMKLFGPTSVILPLRTAYETFRGGGRQTAEELEWYKAMLADIFSRGYGFMSFFIAD